MQSNREILSLMSDVVILILPLIGGLAAWLIRQQMKLKDEQNATLRIENEHLKGLSAPSLGTQTHGHGEGR